MLYSVVAGAGYLAQIGQWGLMAMFGVLLALSLISVTLLRTLGIYELLIRRSVALRPVFGVKQTPIARAAR